MSFPERIKKAADWLSGGSQASRRPPTTRHHDPDLGDYSYLAYINLWRLCRESETGELYIAGRSEHPTDEQKQLLDLLLPLLPGLTEQTLRGLEVPSGFTQADLPDKLTLHEIRFEANGDVYLFFEPGLVIQNYDATPMATCSEDGRLQSVCWTV